MRFKKKKEIKKLVNNLMEGACLYMIPFQCAADVSVVPDEIVDRLAALRSPISVVNEIQISDSPSLLGLNYVVDSPPVL